MVPADPVQVIRENRMATGQIAGHLKFGREADTDWIKWMGCVDGRQ